MCMLILCTYIIVLQQRNVDHFTTYNVYCIYIHLPTPCRWGVCLTRTVQFQQDGRSIMADDNLKLTDDADRFFAGVLAHLPGLLPFTMGCPNRCVHVFGSCLGLVRRPRVGNTMSEHIYIYIHICAVQCCCVLFLQRSQLHRQRQIMRIALRCHLDIHACVDPMYPNHPSPTTVSFVCSPSAGLGRMHVGAMITKRPR